MLEQVKEVLIEKYNKQKEDADLLKKQIDEIGGIILSDNSEEVYKNNLKGLKAKKLKKNSPEYNAELNKINSIYNQGLLDFKVNHDKYLELRKKYSMIDIYGINRKITRVENATSLEDLKLDEEKAAKILSGELEDI